MGFGEGRLVAWTETLPSFGVQHPFPVSLMRLAEVPCPIEQRHLEHRLLAACTPEQRPLLGSGALCSACGHALHPNLRCIAICVGSPGCGASKMRLPSGSTTSWPEGANVVPSITRATRSVFAQQASAQAAARVFPPRCLASRPFRTFRLGTGFERTDSCASSA